MKRSEIYSTVHTLYFDDWYGCGQYECGSKPDSVQGKPTSIHRLLEGIPTYDGRGIDNVWIMKLSLKGAMGQDKNTKCPTTD